MSPPSPYDPAGAAALSICESLLLSLCDQGLIDEAEFRAILTDAAEAHRGAQVEGSDVQFHTRTAELIERILRSRAGEPGG